MAKQRLFRSAVIITGAQTIIDILFTVCISLSLFSFSCCPLFFLYSLLLHPLPGSLFSFVCALNLPVIVTLAGNVILFLLFPSSGIDFLNIMNIHFFFKNYLFIYLFIYLFMAVLSLLFCARAFSSCGKRGPLFITVRGPLTIVASLVAEHRLQTRRLSSCGSRA